MTVSKQQAAEIEQIRASQAQTRRATVPALEEILYNPLPVLDHGFVRVVDYMGDDSAITQAARVSYGKGTKKVQEDKGLINYLLRHWHTTPFEMCEIKYHIKLPIFIARQWIRHRTANVNEYSARYSIMDREFYIPAMEQLGVQSKSNRQGRGDVLQGDEAQKVLKILREDSERCYQHYMEMMNLKGEDGGEETEPQILDPNKSGLARELARMNLNLNFYTQWYWKTDLHNLMHFCRLRADPHAQYEIRVYAETLLETMKRWVPHTFEAYTQYREGALNISKQGVTVLKRMLAGEKVTEETAGLGKREWKEFCESLGINDNATSLPKAKSA
ncbi:MAG: FAD-dependent thymidylate synthase [Alphaproteobacteria bacterium]|nr:MAG: FAD-dependent thymidylate synthase [Alphaproteobacteria bacterium]